MPGPRRPAVHVVVPAWIDDPARPSGGNTYDRRICSGLARSGWDVRLHRIRGDWPAPTAADLTALAAVLHDMAGGALVLMDGLIGSAALPVLQPLAARLRLVVLIHLPLGVSVTPGGAGSVAEAAEAAGAAGTGSADDGGRAATAHAERSVLALAAAVITTSPWTRRWLLDRYGLPPDTVHTAVPGVDAAEPSCPSPGGGRLLCVAAVAPVKGHDVLVAALAGLRDSAWHVRCVGSVSTDPAFAAGLRTRVADAGLAGRVEWSGALTGPQLRAAYADADVLLVPSRVETYGMVATEALARGVPVIGSAVGGLPDAVGAVSAERRGLPDAVGAVAVRTPGLLVPPDNPAALRDALRRWLSEPALRADLRAAASARRVQLRSWAVTTADVARVLVGVAGQPHPASDLDRAGAAAR